MDHKRVSQYFSRKISTQSGTTDGCQWVEKKNRGENHSEWKEGHRSLVLVAKGASIRRGITTLLGIMPREGESVENTRG